MTGAKASATSMAAPESGLTAADEPEPATPDLGGQWPRGWSASLAGALYLALAFALWWHAWSISPSGVMTCDCSDAGRMVWYFEWVPFALGQGHSLLHSTYQFHPAGFSLLADTSTLAIATVLSPVTALFGPVVAMNTASTLIPAATAFSMYWLLLRWVHWTPAAFVGGLAYGFSAWVVVQLSFGWINLACVALLPLMVACLDELLIRQRRGAATVGAALAILFVIEFFVSVEMALLAALAGLVATLLVVGSAWLFNRARLRSHLGHGATGLGTALAVGAVLMAYPVWVFVRGPGHLPGRIWSTSVPGSLGNTVGNLWDPVGQYGSISSKSLAVLAHAIGGFEGRPWPSPSYLGWGTLVVLAAGLIVWRRDRRLWLFGALGVITFGLSLTAGPHHWGPWSVLDRIPLLLNAEQYRLAGIFVLCATAMLGIVVDRCHSATIGWLTNRPSKHAAHRVKAGHQLAAGRGTAAVREAAASLALLVAAVALVPQINVLSPNLPITMRPVTVPGWFTNVARRLPAGVVLATYPFPTANSQASIPWQAISGMPYQMAGGGGPTGTVARAGREARGFAILGAASVTNLPPPSLDRTNLLAVRSALTEWGVTMVVVPDDTGLPRFQTGRGTAFGVAFFTAVLGSAPVRQDGAWVWTDVRRVTAAPLPTGSATLSSCVAAPRSGPPDADPWAVCVLGSAPHG